MARALASDRYEELLAQLLSCLTAVSREQREEVDASHSNSHSKPYRDRLKFPSVVVVGYRAIKEYREVAEMGITPADVVGSSENEQESNAHHQVGGALTCILRIWSTPFS